MLHGLSSRLALLVLTISPLAVLADVIGARPGHAVDFCSYAGLHTFLWTGNGDGQLWTDGANWDGGVAPGIDDQDDGYVCIPDGASVTVPFGKTILIQALDLDDGGELVVGDLEGSFKAEDGRLRASVTGGLFVFGDPTVFPSRVRGLLGVLESAVGGPGRFIVEGTLNPSSGTLASDPCSVIEGLPASACAAGTGTTSIASGGRLEAHLLLELRSGYDVLVNDRMTLGGSILFDAAMAPSGHPPNSISLSARSRLVVRPGARLSLRKAADVFQTGPAVPRAQLINRGRITRVARRAPGRPSVISVRYRGTGLVDVRRNAGIAITDGARATRVAPGAVSGAAPCQRKRGTCSITTSDVRGQRQAALLGVTDADPQDGPATVTVVPRPGLRRPQDVGIPYLVHAEDMHATRSHPSILVLRYDASLVHGRRPRDVSVLRQAAAGGPRTVAVPCRRNGTPPGRRRFCVDLRDRATSSRVEADGDLVMVVRTLVTSRWVIR